MWLFLQYEGANNCRMSFMNLLIFYMSLIICCCVSMNTSLVLNAAHPAWIPDYTEEITPVTNINSLNLIEALFNL